MDNDEKILKVLETLVTDLGGIKTDISSLRQGQINLEAKKDKLELKIENAVIDKVSALFDAREVQNDVNVELLSILNRIEAKVDVLQMETASIRRVK